MNRKTGLLPVACAFLLVLTSCHTHKANQHWHGHEKTTEHSTNLTGESKMRIEKPNRISHTYEHTINGTVEEIMPLYCPVREVDWCEGWNPKVVYSNSGLVEKDCIFITSHGDDNFVWVVTDYDIEKGHVEMVYLIPNVLVTKLEIRLTPISKEITKAEITYSKTSLVEIGEKVLEKFTKEEYDIMMDSWEKAMNHYLKTGEMLTGLPNF